MPSHPLTPKPSTTSRVRRKGTVSGVPRVLPCSNIIPKSIWTTSAVITSSSIFCAWRSPIPSMYQISKLWQCCGCISLYYSSTQRDLDTFLRRKNEKLDETSGISLSFFLFCRVRLLRIAKPLCSPTFITNPRRVQSAHWHRRLIGPSNATPFSAPTLAPAFAPLKLPHLRKSSTAAATLNDKYSSSLLEVAEAEQDTVLRVRLKVLLQSKSKSKSHFPRASVAARVLSAKT